MVLKSVTSVHIVSLAICIFCMPVVVRLMILSRRVDGMSRRIHLILTSVLLGTTLWASNLLYLSHFIGEVPHVFDGIRVFAAQILAISGAAISLWICIAHRNRWIIGTCGALFGLTNIAVFHFGFTAIAMPAEVIVPIFVLFGQAFVSAAWGAVTTLVLTRRRLQAIWKRVSVLLVVIVLVPQHVFAIFLTIVETEQALYPRFGFDQQVMIILASAALAVCLMWSVAAFVTQAHELRVRRALLKDATLLDPLTELPNRLRLEQHFLALKGYSNRRYLHPAAVLLFNIDDFKSINEMHGNAVGDEVLREVAHRLSLQSNEAEFVARMGADEFVVVLNHVPNSQMVADFAKEMMARLSPPISISRILLRPGFSIGYALLPEDGGTHDELLVKAEVALRRAKISPGQKIQRFDPEMDQQERDRATMLQELRGAADRGELYLNYQMQHDIQTEELCGFEVLLRWKHPQRGTVSPSVFIPLAESSGLIRQIGMWVIEESCNEAATWHRPYSIAVNVAPQQLLEPGFAEAVQNILEKTGLPARRLELEITEASIIEDEENTLGVMHKLRGMGIRIAMDDFGTGYSSLAMLQAFPFDKIKIDRSFVINVHENPERAAIIQATVLIGEAMAIPILVEGVEIREELTFLRRAKCHVVQGFIFGHPLEVEDVRKLAVIPDNLRVASFY